ncbi:unnamed protein product [Acanthoscelides obtectus]|uniref:Uncharacterized protein n=1 Tax=Acanthoscelides obtectus TaxID=200917 RepID=A0A9P0QB51_ACAOB|nr:unnamed protein product [Acanthoscelides obtectus]CAK1642272.1 hypothetical protein AOBTE_LOCUS12940 [Acanthoscelides obtectus]
MNLLPHLCLTPENRKLQQTRTKMQQLVIEEQEVCSRRSVGLSTCLPPTPSPARRWTQEANSHDSLLVPKASTQDHQTYQELHTMGTNN